MKLDKDTIKISCKIVKEVFKRNSYCVFGCILLKPNEKIKLTSFGNFTITGDLSYLTEGSEYEMIVKEGVTNKYGTQYEVVEVPSLASEIDDLTPTMELKILSEITTENQAKNIHEAYPNFIQMVLDNRVEEIEVSKIRNVGEYRLNVYIRIINEKFKYYSIIQQAKHYELKMEHAKKLSEQYGSVNEVLSELKERPYYNLTEVCGIGFKRADKLILGHDESKKECPERAVALMLHILNMNEEEGNTYMDAIELAEYCNGHAPELVHMLKDVAVESDLIYYNEEHNFIARMNTYLAECSIASFIVSAITDKKKKLDWDWQKYTKIKHGTLTEEQSNNLKEFCCNNVMILNAKAGSGKTSSLLALIEMMEDNHMSYKILTATGRASARVAEQTGRQASTFHRACGFGQQIDTDCVIIEEASMVSMEHMIMLLNTINYNTRLYILGDTGQLAPIGLGLIMKDLIDSGLVTVTTLSKVFRFAGGGLAYVTTQTYYGKDYLEGLDLSKPVILGDDKDFKHVEVSTEEVLNTVVHEYTNLISKGAKPKDIAIITPLNKYELGSVNINNVIQGVINPPKKEECCLTRKWEDTTIHFRKGDLVMITQNDYKRVTLEGYTALQNDSSGLLKAEDVETVAVFNGMIGQVLSVYNTHLVLAVEDLVVVYDKYEVNNLLLAYASNPFKLQGSEVPYSIVIVDNTHKFMLNRNLLYTALSRGKQLTIEVGQHSTVQYALSEIATDKKLTLLKSLLTERYNKSKIE